MWKDIIEKVISAILIAAMLAVLALLARGVLVSALGGVTKKELAAEVDRQLRTRPGGLLSLRDAVVAFDAREGCPNGWSEAKDMKGLIIIGASDKYKYRRPGGDDYVTLKLTNMPDHDHSYEDIYFAHAANPPTGADRVNVPERKGATGRTDHNNSGWAIPDRRTATTGGGKAFNIMPPYMPLYLCTPDRGGKELNP